MEGLTKLQLRDISYEGRITFIKEQVKDLAYRELLYKMLEDKSRRPSAAVLLQDESLLFISYLLEETDIDLGEINKNEKCLPALISCLNLTNKNKAVIAFLALMNLYGVMPKQVLQLLEQEHQYIAILELLFICLKEQNDSEFANLYSKGIDILNYFLLKEPRNPEIRSQYALGGIINLIMLAIDNQAIELIEQFSVNYTQSVIQITETCGFLETIDEMAEQSLKFSEARYQFMSKTAQYYGIDNFIKSSSILNANDMIQIIDLIKNQLYVHFRQHLPRIIEKIKSDSENGFLGVFYFRTATSQNCHANSLRYVNITTKIDGLILVLANE